MKKFAMLLGGLVVICVAAAVIAPFVIPMDTYKAEITRRVKQATGRDLVIAGPMHATLFPSVGVEMEKVTFSNPKGYSTPTMAELAKVKVLVELLPLLRKEVEVKSLVLTKPVIHLEVSGKGVPNWQFTPPSGASALPVLHSGRFALVSSANALEEEEKTEAAQSVGGMLRNLRLADVRIIDGTLQYRDGTTAESYALAAVNLKAELSDISAPLVVTGSAQFNDEIIAVDAKVETPALLLSGQEAGVVAKISGNPVQLSFNGRATQTGANGEMTLAVPSLPRLSAWAGAPMDWKGKTALSLDAGGVLHCTRTQCMLKNASVKLDNTLFKGELGVVWAGAVPFIAADLATDALDANPYLAAQADAPARFALIAGAQAADAPGGWSTEKIDLGGLRAVNADIALKAKSVAARAFTLQDMKATAKLNGGVLQVNIPSARLYGGAMRMQLTADGSGAAPAISQKLVLEKVQAEPLLKDLAGFDRLSGLANLSLDVNGRGSSQQQIVSSLAGDGKLMLTDGAIKGINIAQLVRDVKATVTGASTAGQKTDFAALGGSFTIAQGILSNRDLAMKAPLLRLKGEGKVDLPRQYVNYRLTPEIVNTLAGQGGKDTQGLAVPVIVEGPFAQLTFRPDLQAAMQDALENPEKLKETVKSVKEQIQENKGGLKDALKELKTNPDAVGDLLRGFGR